jgi:hypothetical protein
MCDFSAAAAKSRTAAKADRLLTHHISSHTKGFVDAKDHSMAVCLLPGTQLAFAAPVRAADILNHDKKVFPFKTAKFVQVDKDDPAVHHDALEFPDGQTVKLNLLFEGQQATVLQLPAEPRNEREREEQRRAEYA